MVRACKDYKAETVIVDNSSFDETVTYLERLTQELRLTGRDVSIVKNDTNIGFTKAVNQGLIRGDAVYVLLLNPDVVVPDETLEKLIDHLDQFPEVGVVAPQLRYADGRVQPSCRRFPKLWDIFCEFSGLSRAFRKSALFNRWKMGDFDHLTFSEVDQPQGAFLLIRREAFAEVGMLDERFEMFFSDVDWCRRVWEKGWKIHFCPSVVAIHHKGASVYENRAKMLILSHRDFVRYVEKYLVKNTILRWFILQVFLIAVWPRVVIALFEQEKNRKK